VVVPEGTGPSLWCARSTFMDNDVHGRGTFVFARQKAKYTGQFRHNKKHGKGVYVWATGNRQEG
jgi:hypothetical protein